jgi:hypothetical protein
MFLDFKKGEVLYSGRRWNDHNEGFFEIQADDTEVKLALQLHHAIERARRRIKQSFRVFKISIGSSWAKQIFVDQNIVLSYLVKRKTVLKSNFRIDKQIKIKSKKLIHETLTIR